MCIAELDEAGHLVGGIAVDGAAEVHGVVGKHADRMTADTGETGDDTDTESGSKFEKVATVDEVRDGIADVVDTCSLRRYHVAQGVVVTRARVDPTASEEGEIVLGRLDCGGFVGDADVNHAVGGLHVDRADRRGCDLAEATAFDHRRTGHADVGILRGDDDVAATEECGVAGEAVARGDTDHRDESRELSEEGKSHAIETGDAG